MAKKKTKTIYKKARSGFGSMKPYIASFASGFLEEAIGGNYRRAIAGAGQIGIGIFLKHQFSRDIGAYNIGRAVEYNTLGSGVITVFN